MNYINNIESFCRSPLNFAIYSYKYTDQQLYRNIIKRLGISNIIILSDYILSNNEYNKAKKNGHKTIFQ